MVRGIGLALLLLVSSGCNSVRPYQRELLSLPGMGLASTPDNEGRQHMLETREASFGGYGSAGGGCGCN
jgi:hypothetical protein